MISIQSVLFLAIVVKIALCKKGYIAITNEGSAHSVSSAEKMCMDTFGSHLASIHDRDDALEVMDLCKESQADICWLGSTQLPRIAPCKLSGWLDKSSVDYQPTIICDGAYQPLPDCCAGRNMCISLYYMDGTYWMDSCKAQPKDTTKKFYPICNPPTPPPTPSPTPSRFEILELGSNYNKFSDAYYGCILEADASMASLHNEEEQQEAKNLCFNSGADVCRIGGTIQDKPDCSSVKWQDGSPTDFQALYAYPENNGGCNYPYLCFMKGWGGIRNCAEEIYNDGNKKIWVICNGKHSLSAANIPLPTSIPTPLSTPSPTALPTPTPRFEIVKESNYNSVSEARAACIWQKVAHIASLHNEEEQEEAKDLCFNSGANICWIGGTIQDKPDCSSVKWADGSPTDFEPLYAAYENNWGCNNQNLCFIKGYGGMRNCAEQINNDGSKKIWAICNGKKPISAANAINIKPISYDDNVDNLSYLFIVVVVIMVNIFMYCFMYIVCIKPRIRSTSYNKENHQNQI